MLEVARCESGLRHFNNDGTVLRGIVDHDDTGAFQINMRYWGEEAEKRKIDLLSLKGNIDMARIIYESYGTKPWYASKKCWDKEKSSK